MGSATASPANHYSGRPSPEWIPRLTCSNIPRRGQALSSRPLPPSPLIRRFSASSADRCWPCAGPNSSSRQRSSLFSGPREGQSAAPSPPSHLSLPSQPCPPDHPLRAAATSRCQCLRSPSESLLSCSWVVCPCSRSVCVLARCAPDRVRLPSAPRVSPPCARFLSSKSGLGLGSMKVLSPPPCPPAADAPNRNRVVGHWPLRLILFFLNG